MIEYGVERGKGSETLQIYCFCSSVKKACTHDVYNYIEIPKIRHPAKPSTDIQANSTRQMLTRDCTEKRKSRGEKQRIFLQILNNISPLLNVRNPRMFFLITITVTAGLLLVFAKNPLFVLLRPLQLSHQISCHGSLDTSFYRPSPLGRGGMFPI